MKTVAIIQARMGSTRLPGKVAMDICGKTMLERVVERTRLIPGVDETAVAIPESDTNTPLIGLCKGLDVPVHLGSEYDVLSRYVKAARACDADAVVRVTSDCPLLDPVASGQVVRRFHQELPDYASNTLTRTFPRGLDTEVVSRKVLELAAEQATDRADREHVTRFVWRQPERFRLLSVENEVDESHHRWTVDTIEDLELVRRIYGALGNSAFDFRNVLELLAARPDWVEMNAHVEQKKL